MVKNVDFKMIPVLFLIYFDRGRLLLGMDFEQFIVSVLPLLYVKLIEHKQATHNT